MTEKELLYLEDAVNHEMSIVKILEESIKKLKAEDLQTFLKKEQKKHETTLEKLMKLLEEKANE